jgi:hypothetical protein
MKRQKKRQVWNVTMQRKLASGECLSVRAIGEPIADRPGYYRLREFIDDKDYCDPEYEIWMWSIGRNLKTGEIIAAYNGSLYLNEEYECLWLR